MRLIVKIQQVFVHWIIFTVWGHFPLTEMNKHAACRCLWKNKQYVCSHDKSDSVGLIKMLPIMVGEIFPLCI